MADEQKIYESDWLECGYCGTRRPKKKLGAAAGPGKGPNCGPDEADLKWCREQAERNRKATDARAASEARERDQRTLGDTAAELVQDLEAKSR